MMYEGLLRIPMVVKLAGRGSPRSGVVHEPVQLVDILPTVLQAIGAPRAGRRPGAAAPAGRAQQLAEEHINPEFVSLYGEVYDRALRVIYDGRKADLDVQWRALALRPRPRSPRGENLIAQEPERAREMERRLEAMMSSMVAEAAPPSGSN